MLDYLMALDTKITLAINGSNSLFADGAMMCITSTWTWIPLALVLIFLLIKNNDMPTFSFIMLSLALCILFSDQVASGICKPLFHRFRPTNDPHIMYLLDVVNDYRGGKYGFFSSHAANTFSVATFLCFLFRRRVLSILLLSWAFLNGWSRIYLGVHYFGDVTVGTIWGIIVGSTIYYVLYKKLLQNKISKISTNNSTTKTGYLISDTDTLSLAILITYFFVVIRGLVFC